MTESLIVYCADIGSVASKRFGWCRFPVLTDGGDGSDMLALAESVVADLLVGRPVALGFECPLFVPLASEPVALTSARSGEGNRPWSAGAGCGALTTGLVQMTWLLRRIKEGVPASVQAHLDWDTFRAEGKGLFLWEAFVSGPAKRDGHTADAGAGVEAFVIATQQPHLTSCIIPSAETYSLVGGALLRSGWSTDIRLLWSPCTVIRAVPRTQPNRGLQPAAASASMAPPRLKP